MAQTRSSTGPVPLDHASLDVVTGGATEGRGEDQGGPADTLIGSDGRDMLFGGSGDDVLMGGDGDDYLVGGAGADVVSGGAGDDRVVWHPNSGNDTIDGGDGTDLLEITGFDISLEDILAAITVAPGSPQPTIVDGMISLAGVQGTLTIGDTQLTFSGMERLVVNA